MNKIKRQSLMALKDREISLSYFHKVLRSVQFNPQRNKTSSYQSPVEVVKFLRIPQQDSTSSTRRFPYNRVYFSKRNSPTFRLQDMKTYISSATFKDLFSLNPTNKRNRLAHICIHCIRIS